MVIPVGRTHNSLDLTVIDKDAKGRVSRVTNPLGHATTYEFDANGNRRKEITMRTNASG